MAGFYQIPSITGSLESNEARGTADYLPQHCLYFLPLPQGHGSLRPTFGPVRTGLAFSTAAAASLTTSLGFGAGAPELPVAVPPLLKALVV